MQQQDFDIWWQNVLIILSEFDAIKAAKSVMADRQKERAKDRLRAAKKHIRTLYTRLWMKHCIESN